MIPFTPKKLSLNPEPFFLSLDAVSIELGRHYWDRDSREQIGIFLTQNGLEKSIKTLFTNNQLNVTEQRAVTHVAWRDHSHLFSFHHQKEIQHTLDRAYAFVNQIHSSTEITDVVNVGIGGSHLGCALVCDALQNYGDKKLQAHFLSASDPDALESLLKKLNPKKTLWLFTSKTFTTVEILSLLKYVKDWFLTSCTKEDLNKHFFAITSQVARAEQEGFQAEQCFWFDEGVGGRFSLWSTVGLIIMLVLGVSSYQELCAGAHAMDKHFYQAPLMENIPVCLAWLDYFYAKYLSATSRMVEPYSVLLSLLPSYLQQLEMESLGKSVTREGEPHEEKGLVVWGGVGPNGQHAFHQFLYQSNQFIPAEFIVLKQGKHFPELVQEQLAQCLAQSKALWEGLPDEVDSHKKIDSFKPSSIILLQALTPYTLGMLLALYEHKVFVSSELYSINAFDQYGVELGKKLAKPILAAFHDENAKASLDNISKNIFNIFTNESSSPACENSKG
ncbi:MAG: glucose-6-phosphate isomerase [Gammaproteobacteria bacterium]|jgi:glucose-6-phosphate isomerase|nr:glucose-6-phosphate isomerase [Gammaproteobacteria bacterium]